MSRMPPPRPEPLQRGKCALKKREKSEGHHGIVDKPKPRVTPPRSPAERDAGGCYRQRGRGLFNAS